LLTCQHIVQNPAPLVAVKGMDAVAIELELLYRVTSPANRTPARNEVIDTVYQHCAANGMAFAPPPQSFLHVRTAKLGDQDIPTAIQPSSRAL